MSAGLMLVALWLLIVAFVFATYRLFRVLLTPDAYREIESNPLHKMIDALEPRCDPARELRASTRPHSRFEEGPRVGSEYGYRALRTTRPEFDGDWIGAAEWSRS